MFDALILVCNLSGDCNSLLSPVFFTSQQQCEELTEQEIYKLSLSHPDKSFSYKCINWGLST